MFSKHFQNRQNLQESVAKDSKTLQKRQVKNEEKSSKNYLK